MKRGLEDEMEEVNDTRARFSLDAQKWVVLESAAKELLRSFTQPRKEKLRYTCLGSDR